MVTDDDVRTIYGEMVHTKNTQPVVTATARQQQQSTYVLIASGITRRELLNYQVLLNIYDQVPKQFCKLRRS